MDYLNKYLLYNNTLNMHFNNKDNEDIHEHIFK